MFTIDSENNITAHGGLAANTDEIAAEMVATPTILFIALTPELPSG